MKALSCSTHTYTLTPLSPTRVHGKTVGISRDLRPTTGNSQISSNLDRFSRVGYYLSFRIVDDCLLTPTKAQKAGSKHAMILRKLRN
eukprot:scaffold649002_cov48-Prasinocladus_malaysianus.AAC.1